MFFFLVYLYSAGSQHGNLNSAGRPVLFCGPTEEPVLTTANRKKEKKIGREFGKNAGEWTGRIEINKEEILGSKHSMYGYSRSGDLLNTDCALNTIEKKILLLVVCVV